MKKAWIAVGGSLVLLGLAWAGAAVMVGIQVQDTLKDLAVQVPNHVPSPWRMRLLAHERGLFQSHGKFEVDFSLNCQAKEEDAAFTVQYTINHVPTPGAWARFQWQLTPTGQGAGLFEALFGSATVLRGQGQVGLAGAVRSSWSLPTVAWRHSGGVIEMSPTQGAFEMAGHQMVLRAQVNRWMLQGKGDALSMDGFSMNWSIDDWRKGTGSGHFKVNQANTPFGMLEGLELRMEATEKGDRLNLSMTQSLRKLEAAGQLFTDLGMQWAVNGLHTESVESLIQLLDSRCGVQGLTAQENKVAAKALQTIMVKGFSVGIPKLTGQTASGRLVGEFWLELQAAHGGFPSLVEQFRSKGTLEMDSSLLSPEQRELALASGYVLSQGDSLKASYEYARGGFRVNHRTMNATAFENLLQQADAQIRLSLEAMQ